LKPLCQLTPFTNHFHERRRLKGIPSSSKNTSNAMVKR